MAKHPFDNAAECQKYLHKLMAAVDRHNQADPVHPKRPNWEKLQEHIKPFEDYIDWQRIFEDRHFSPHVRDSLLARDENGLLINKYAFDYIKYKQDIRESIRNNDITFKDVERASHLFNEADWQLVSHNRTLFDNLVESGNLSSKDLENIVPYFDDYHWMLAGSNQELSEAFLEKHRTQIPLEAWSEISFYQDMSEAFMQRYLDEGLLDAQKLSVGQKLSMDFINANLDRLDMNGLCQAQELTNEFIDMNADRISEDGWQAISEYQRLDIGLLERHQDKIDWTAYSANNMISEKLIARLGDRIDWDAAAAHNPFTYQVAQEDEHGNVLHTNMLQMQLLEKHMNKIGITKLKDNPAIQEAMQGREGRQLSARLNKCFDYEMDLKQQLKKNFEVTQIRSNDVQGKDVYQKVYQGKYLRDVADMLRDADDVHPVKSGIDYMHKAKNMLEELNGYHLIKRLDGNVSIAQTAENMQKQDKKLKRNIMPEDYYVAKAAASIKHNNITQEAEYHHKISILDGVATKIMLQEKMPVESIKSAIYTYSPIVRAEKRVAEKAAKYVLMSEDYDMAKTNPEKYEKIARKNVNYEKYTDTCIKQVQKTLHARKELGIE